MPSEKPLILFCEEGANLPFAEQLSERLSVPLTQQLPELNGQLMMLLDDRGLSLAIAESGLKTRVIADFSGGAVDHRRKFGGGLGQMIAKAVGLKSGVRPTVLDATAGLGRDSFVLASLGCTVAMIERNPIVHALLEDGLQRAREGVDEVAEIAARMRLLSADSRHWLSNPDSETPSYQVVYLDPMFPHRQKTALVKKEMRVFRDLVGDDPDADELLEGALSLAENRVVVKRPRKAPLLCGKTPSFQLEGKSSRFDIYALKKLS